MDARFLGTGQAGILISGAGVALDAVRVDYAAGAVEQAVLRAAAQAGPEVLLLVEGQGSFCHPGSCATLPLIRGSQPTQLLLAHRAGQRFIQNQPHIPVPAPGQLITILEAMAALARPQDSVYPPPRVVAMALNTSGLDGDAAVAAIAAMEDEVGLPCVDPVRQGADQLLEAVTTG